MIKFFYSLLFFFIINNLWSLELKCHFEEVYPDSVTQQGFLLIKNNSLRYQYYDQNLFTIFAHKNRYFYNPNYQTSSFFKIEQNNIIIEKLLELALQYPNIETEYFYDNYYLKIEKALTNTFIKRMSIKSAGLNVSIYLKNCEADLLNDNLFGHFPYIEYRY